MTDITAGKIVHAIKTKYHDNTNRWIYLPELRNGIGYSFSRAIDAFAIALWPSDKHLRIAYEVKVSKSDWNRELKQPNKRDAFIRISNEFYFVAPPGIIPHDKVPVGCGLIECDPREMAFNKIFPSDYNESNPNWGLICSIFREVMRIEAPND